MPAEPLTPENTTIILMDYAIGFGNVFRSHPLAANRNNAVLLADMALQFGAGLVVTNGPPEKTCGPYYTEVQKVLGDHPIIERGGMFNAFLFDAFKQAVAETGRKNVVISGIVTEGCVLQTTFGGLREGYNVHVAVDACAGQTLETHQTALTRMIQAGVVPLTAFSLASEFTVDQDRPVASKFFDLTAKYEPEMAFLSAIFQSIEMKAKPASQRRGSNKRKESRRALGLKGRESVTGKAGRALAHEHEACSPASII